MVCSSERTDGEALHYTDNTLRFFCHGHACFLLHRKQGHLFVIMSVLMKLRFLPTSALPADQERLATVSLCLYQNYSQDFSPSPYC